MARNLNARMVHGHTNGHFIQAELESTLYPDSIIH